MSANVVASYRPAASAQPARQPKTTGLDDLRRPDGSREGSAWVQRQTVNGLPVAKMYFTDSARGRRFAAHCHNPDAPETSQAWTIYQARLDAKGMGVKIAETMPRVTLRTGRLSMSFQTVDGAHRYVLFDFQPREGQPRKPNSPDWVASFDLDHAARHADDAPDAPPANPPGWDTLGDTGKPADPADPKNLGDAIPY